MFISNYLQPVAQKDMLSELTSWKSFLSFSNSNHGGPPPVWMWTQGQCLTPLLANSKSQTLVPHHTRTPLAPGGWQQLYSC